MKRRFPKGGYTFPVRKKGPSTSFITSPLPKKVTIPLIAAHGTVMDLTVKKGDAVTAGDIIARNDQALGPAIVASISGVVEHIGEIGYLGRSVTAVTIRSSGTDSVRDIRHISRHQCDVIYISGASACGCDGIPTQYNSSRLSPASVTSIIITAIDSEPFSVLNETLLLENAKQFTEGVNLLHRLFGKVLPVHIVARSGHIKRLGFTGQMKERPWLHVHAGTKKYPHTLSIPLIERAFGRALSDKEDAVSLGCVILNVRDVLAINEAVNHGRPLIEHIFEVTGPGFGRSALAQARIGTPLKHLLPDIALADTGMRWVLNSVMSGTVIDDPAMPVTPLIQSIICIPEKRERELLWFLRPGSNRDSYSGAYLGGFMKGVTKDFNTNMHGEARPCISCGWCEEVCPRQTLMPHQIVRYAEKGLFEEAARFRPFLCIECGLCSYVCPSKLPLLERIRQCKQELQKAETP
ncbi:MAG: 4Fe-4S dicluster domain-containing protein [Candidatus Omnitrophica bacterium]|nr:4Fe-4S dicluster domain-containing protein [Candidatus Omnitrophota bacterium]